jgi:hypothetical protein
MSEEDVVVRAAKKMASVIKAAVPKANVFHYWILGQGDIGSSWPDVQSPDEDAWSAEGHSTWAHAYIIGFDEEESKKVTNARRRDFTTFRLWGFYGFYKGNATKNSSDLAIISWHTAKNALTKATRFQQVDDTVNDPNGVPEVEQHGEWQITASGVYWMGTGNKCHIAQGNITVDSSLVLLPTTITG